MNTEAEEGEEAGEALFGSFDGLTSVIGVMIGLAAASASVIVKAGFGLAAASTGGMAAGQYLKDRSAAVPFSLSVRHAVVMGAATCLGTVLPLLPFLVVRKHPAQIAAVFVVAVVTIAIAWYRARSAAEKITAWVETLVILAVVSALSIVVAVLTGSA